MGTHMAGHHLVSILRREPSRISVSRKSAYGSVSFSDVQQRAFFAMLDSGRISVPRPRTGGLMAGWYVEEKSDGSISIGNRRRYSRYVVDEKRQSRMQRIIGWISVQETVRGELPIVRTIIRNEVEKSIRR